jgi:hypothetical protein
MPGGSALLVVGHPGHELRVHGWLESVRAVVMVLTDGSGHTGQSRLRSTAVLLDRAGAKAGPIFGRFTDAALYRALLDGETSVFVELAEELAATIIRHRIAVVAGDDAEGYNPAHDVCRMIIDTAVDLARPHHRVANLAFLLMENPGHAAPSGHRGTTSQIALDDGGLARKISAALNYPEMAAEVAYARRTWGDDAFRVETFRHVAAGELWAPMDAPPFYEQHGARRVQAGTYQEVITYDRHIRPLADALTARVLRRAS